MRSSNPNPSPSPYPSPSPSPSPNPNPNPNPSPRPNPNQALLELGADPAAVVLNGKTALDIARLNERGAVVALLESVACKECE